jgi:DNA (cytosine-5)-methyltransferase 1
MIRRNGIVVDWFAGGGGASSGIRAAIGRPIDIALNHNPKAVAMHRMNHPETHHIEGNAWDYVPHRVVRPGQKIALGWFSPDCTHHSNARGGKPFRDHSYARRLRGLPWVPSRWAKETDMDVFMIENVREMAAWGPIDRKTQKPCPKRRGAHFRKWLRTFADARYQIDMREMVAADYGAPTTRKRLFIIGRKDGKEIVFPEATHGPGRAPYATAADCIDWTDLGKSIFERERPLAEATQRRIYRGYVRYVRDNPRPFIVPLCHSMSGDRVHSIDEPLKTITTAKGGEFALCVPYIVPEGFGERPTQAPRIHSIEEPLSTIVASRNRHALVAAFLVQHQGGYYDAKECNAPPIDGPMPTIMGKGCQTQLVTAFMMSYYGTDQAPQLDAPAPTVRTKDHLALVTIHHGPHKGRYRLVDIRMRMFKPRELFLAQSFDPEYVIDRGLTEDGEEIELTQGEQVLMCGNSVPPRVSEALVRANIGGGL